MEQPRLIKNQYGVFPQLQITREELYKLYVEQKLPLREIARKFNVDVHAIMRFARKCNIGIRGKKGQKFGGVPRKFYGTKQELKQLYYKQGLTTAEIAQQYLMGRRTLEDWMCKLGIPPRNKKQRWANLAYRERALKAMHEGIKRKPTRPELAFQTICEIFNLPFRYVGAGAFFINGFNPDFIENSGRKIAIDIFGDYWHSNKRQNIHYSSTEYGRKQIFQKFGWQLIIIWEHELKNESPNNIVNKVRYLIENPADTPPN